MLKPEPRLKKLKTLLMKLKMLLTKPKTLKLSLALPETLKVAMVLLLAMTSILLSMLAKKRKKPVSTLKKLVKTLKALTSPKFKPEYLSFSDYSVLPKGLLCIARSFWFCIAIQPGVRLQDAQNHFAQLG